MSPPQKREDRAIWTVGHSTRTLDEFVATIAAYGIALIVDVRRFPGSRRLPQFGSADLAAGLGGHHIDYKWLPSLGGRRQASGDSVNTAWTNAGFRGYADHVASEEFAQGLEELLVLSAAVPTAIMCAEVLWWRCHRRIISDVLVTLGIDVIHIRDSTHSEIHKIIAPARIVHGALSYEADSQLGLDIR